jgi:hypothetical protein
MILFACMAGFSMNAFAQQDSIDHEINRLLGCGCFDCPSEDDDIFRQNLVYSVEALHQHLNDTTPCAKNRVHYLTAIMLNFVDSSNYDIVFRYNLLYARDTTNKENYYSSIVDLVRKTVLKGIKLPPSVMQFISSPEFYKATTWKLPLLISYLDMYGEIENLKKWGQTQLLSEHAKGKLMISLLRLGDISTTKEYIAVTPTNSHDWNNYITGLNYARTKPATERLIRLLNNKEKIRYSTYSYSDDSQTYYTTVRSLVLETLFYVVENFPLKEIDVPYEEDHFSEASEADIKKVKRWFKDNPDYKIIRRSDYNY